MSRLRLTHLALAAVVVGALFELRRHARVAGQCRDRVKAPPAEVQTWEGEGGALPDCGSQLGAGSGLGSQTRLPTRPAQN